VVQGGATKVNVIVGFDATRKGHSPVNYGKFFDEFD
jgi:hypothetical protein